LPYGITLSNPRVLLVDDNQAILDCLVRLLGRDYTIVGAIRDGPRMLDAVAILKPDIVVMDISMPEMSGLELARLMQENPPTPPVVFVTVHEDPEFMEAAQAVGAAGYVVKSTMETELKPALELALRGQRFVVQIP
jgi:DNA-binding NarL/FixJ family response regulator